MPDKKEFKSKCPVTVEGVEKAIKSFKEVGEVTDASRGIQSLTAQERAYARKMANLEFRTQVMNGKFDKTPKGELTKLQKDALRGAAILGTTSLADFAFCAKITIGRLRNALKKDKRFAQELSFLGQTTSIAAKRNLISAIEDGDLSISQWWLERHPESELNPNNSKKQQESPLVIIMPADGKQPDIQEGEIVREDEDAIQRGETLSLASGGLER